MKSLFGFGLALFLGACATIHPSDPLDRCVSIVGFTASDASVVEGAVNSWAEVGHPIRVGGTGETCAVTVVAVTDSTSPGFTSGSFPSNERCDIDIGVVVDGWTHEQLIRHLALHELGHVVSGRTDHLPGDQDVMAVFVNPAPVYELTASDITWAAQIESGHR